VKKPGTDEMVSLAELAKTGGIINAYEAVKYASTMSNSPTKEKLPKSTIKKPKAGK
jgi:hypothetical protein